MYKLLLSYTVIPDVYTPFTKKLHLLSTFLLSGFFKLIGSFEIHPVRQYLVNPRVWWTQ